MMNSDDKLTRDIQLIELDMLKDFKRICEKYGLVYFAIGGTCLGAIRHKGFIPWDDDIDLAMPYPDYCQFRDIASNELKDHYEIYDQHRNKHAFHLFCKIHDSSTTYIPSSCYGMKDRYMGVSIDIMPIYGLPDSESEIARRKNICIRYRRLNRVLRMPIKTEASVPAKLFWIINSPKRLFLQYDYYGSKEEKLLGDCPFNASSKVLFGWRCIENRLIFEYEDFRQQIELPFEDTTIAVPIGYDRYLKMDFGNYMELPPEEKRVSLHPAAIIDLKKSYKEYI